MTRSAKVLLASVLIGALLAVPSMVAAWNTTMTKSDTHPGTAGADISTDTIRPGQRVTMTAHYLDICLTSNGQNEPECVGNAASLTDTAIRRAYLMVHHPTLNEWLYLYAERISERPATFTAWAYSPYVNTARGADQNNPRSQRLSDTAIPISSNASALEVNAPVMLTATRRAFTVNAVRIYITNRQLNVEWQLTGGDFPAGTLNLFSSVETRSNYDGWDQVGSVQLQAPPASATPSPSPTLPAGGSPTPVTAPTMTMTPAGSPTAGASPTSMASPTPGGAQTPSPSPTSAASP